jgi:hypothetical protein
MINVNDFIVSIVTCIIISINTARWSSDKYDEVVTYDIVNV